jgi:NAD-dependent deacetylase
MTRLKSIVILTGAGISAESGIRTFRDGNGLWENHRVEDVASPEGFVQNPRLVHDFYNQRRRQLQDPTVKPNAAHMALAQLWEGDFFLVTQNVDDLHERAGSKQMVHMHGQLKSAWCRRCDSRMLWIEDMSIDHNCPACSAMGGLRPDIVWFGEFPYHMDEILERLARCEIFLAIGTSGLVYPAAAFVRDAHRARKYEINIVDSGVSEAFHEHRLGQATLEVPQLVTELLSK